MIPISQLHPACDESFSFRDSIVLPRARLWLRNGAVVTVGSRAFDLLVLLLGTRGEIVPRRQIFMAVWPGVTVGDECLRGQVNGLRRAMETDADLIKTVAGRGYMFAAEPPWLDVQTRYPGRPAEAPA